MYCRYMFTAAWRQQQSNCDNIYSLRCFTSAAFPSFARAYDLGSGHHRAGLPCSPCAQCPGAGTVPNNNCLFGEAGCQFCCRNAGHRHRWRWFFSSRMQWVTLHAGSSWRSFKSNDCFMFSSLCSAFFSVRHELNNHCPRRIALCYYFYLVMNDGTMVAVLVNLEQAVIFFGLIWETAKKNKTILRCSRFEIN